MPTQPSHDDATSSSPDPRSLTRFILRGGALGVGARLVVVLGGFAVQVILARILPPKELGAYFLIQSVVSTVAVFSQMGLDRPLTRDLARFTGRGEDARARGLLLLGLRMSFIPVVGISAIYALGGGAWLGKTLFSSPTVAGASMAGAAWLAGSAFQNLGSSAIRGFHSVGAAAFLGGALTNVVVVATLSALLLAGRGAEFISIVWIAASATWLNVVLCSLFLAKRVRGVSTEPGTSARTLLRVALPLIGAQVAGIAFTHADLWVLGALLPEDDVALYGAAKRVALLIGVPLSALAMVVLPIIADLHSRGESQRLERLLRGSATLAGIPALLVALPCLVLSDSILALIFGPFFAGGGMLLKLFCIQQIAVVFVGPCVAVLSMTGHERDVFVIVVVGGVLSIIAIYLGGHLGGSLGIAIAFTVAGVLREGASLWFVRRRLGIRTDVDFLHLRPMQEAAKRALGR